MRHAPAPGPSFATEAPRLRANMPSASAAAAGSAAGSAPGLVLVRLVSAFPVSPARLSLGAHKPRSAAAARARRSWSPGWHAPATAPSATAAERSAPSVSTFTPSLASYAWASRASSASVARSAAAASRASAGAASTAAAICAASGPASRRSTRAVSATLARAPGERVALRLRAGGAQARLELGVEPPPGEARAALVRQADVPSPGGGRGRKGNRDRAERASVRVGAVAERRRVDARRREGTFIKVRGVCVFARRRLWRVRRPEQEQVRAGSRGADADAARRGVAVAGPAGQPGHRAQPPRRRFHDSVQQRVARGERRDGRGSRRRLSAPPRVRPPAAPNASPLRRPSDADDAGPRAARLCSWRVTTCSSATPASTARPNREGSRSSANASAPPGAGPRPPPRPRRAAGSRSVAGSYLASASNAAARVGTHR